MTYLSLHALFQFVYFRFSFCQSYRQPDDFAAVLIKARTEKTVSHNVRNGKYIIFGLTRNRLIQDFSNVKG